jgi:hypothetical protein
MPTDNPNPIFLDTDAEQSEYRIPSEHKDSLISLSVEIEMPEPGWKYTASHSVFFRGNNLYPQKAPEPENLEIGIAKNLKNKKLAVGAIVSKIIDGGDRGTPPKVLYHLILKAGDNELDNFTLESDNKNLSRFDSLIVFKI